MLSSQEEQNERKRVLAQDASVRDQHLDPVLSQIRELPEHVKERVAKEIKQAEKARGSTLMDHANEEVPGRFAAQSKTQVVGKSQGDPWGPPRPDYWAWADMGRGPTFGKQLHSVDRERGK